MFTGFSGLDILFEGVVALHSLEGILYSGAHQLRIPNPPRPLSSASLMTHLVTCEAFSSPPRNCICIPVSALMASANSLSTRTICLGI